MNESISADDKLLVEQVLTGKPRAVARMMSKAESGTSADRAALAEIFSHAGNAHLVGLTGVPGRESRS